MGGGVEMVVGRLPVSHMSSEVRDVGQGIEVQLRCHLQEAKMEDLG